MYAERQEIDVFTPGQPKQTLGIDDMLDGEDALPGFSVAVRAIFERD